MEDDDEFGDLYTDVLRPLTASFQSQYQKTDVPLAVSLFPASRGSRIDLNIRSNDESSLDVASGVKNVIPNLNSSVDKLNAPIQENISAELDSPPEARRFDLNLDSNQQVNRIFGLAGNGSSGGLEIKARVSAKGGSVNLGGKSSGGYNFMEEDNDIDIVVEEEENKDDDVIEKDNDITNQTQSAMSIVGMKELENPGASNFEDGWESEESEDDLQIVLNDNSHGLNGMERIRGMHDEDDEDDDPLVIVADNGDATRHHHHQQIMMMEEQEWGAEEGVTGTEGEKKELGDTSKAGGSGGAATPAAVQQRIGYSNHMYHNPFHSQFKYVRPGAPPLPGAAPMAPGGAPGQVRPPVALGPVSGRGRGDWRPVGLKGAVPVQKGFPVWGTNAAGRGYGSGLDFTLPSHKTIFEVDIDTFEDKPWNFPGIDKSDFFNFGLNEEGWKDYCKQLEQLRLETTMQSKIRVYESGRTDQDYDPDLPPELAAAVGIQDIPSENANPGNSDAGPIDLTRECARERPPLHIGRPIPVETGSGDRVPSADTRRLRVHDSDAIIEIVCHSSRDDDDMEERQDSDAAEDLRDGGESDDIRQEDREHISGSSLAHKTQKREHIRSHLKNIVGGNESLRKDILPFPSDVSARYHSNRDFVGPRKKRSTEERELLRSPGITTSENGREKEILDYHSENSFDGADGKQSPFLPSQAVGSDAEQDTVLTDDVTDKSVIDDKSFDEETNKMSVDATNKDTLEENYLMHSTEKREKTSSRVEEHSEENDGGEYPRALRSRESSKARSASSKERSKDHQKFLDGVEDEVLQEKHPPHSVNIKRPEGEEDSSRRKGHQVKVETERHHLRMKVKEDSYSRRGVDHDSSLHSHVKSGSADWRKKSDPSEGSWRRRDEDSHSRRIDATKREHGGETGSRSWSKARENERSEKDEHKRPRKPLDNESWRGGYQEQEIGSRLKDRDDYLKTRNEKVDDLRSKRRKEDAHVSRELAEKESLFYNQREGNSSRKRGRYEGSDQWKRDVPARSKDGSLHPVRQKEESLQKDRSERQRERDEWHGPKSHEEIMSRRKREETRPAMRSGRGTEDKTWMSNSRGKDEHKSSSREYHMEDVGRHSEQPRRRDRAETEGFSLIKDIDSVNTQGDGKRVRSGPYDERDAYSLDTSRAHEHKHKESSRKNRESKSGEHSSLIPSKRTQDKHIGQISKTVSSREKTEKETGKNEIHIKRESSGKDWEEASSDDEQHDSRKGRSKFERWTSHKERECHIAAMSPSSLNNKDLIVHNIEKAALSNEFPEKSSKKVDDKLHLSVDDKNSGAEISSSKAKATEDKHLDTVEKLKKRSERFKLPMPREKDSQAIKKTDEPLNSLQTDNQADSEIKSERPARKRRWTGT